MSVAKRPYVICHMGPSIDGRIVATKWKVQSTLTREYERTHRSFDADAWMIGRISMEPYAGKTKVARRKVSPPIPRTDFVARHDAESYAIALDPSGKFTWRSSSIDAEHVITVLTEKVSDAYLAFLRSKGVSYVFGGKKDVDLKRVLQKLRQKFGIRKLLLEGGGSINGSFLAAGLIDELSVLVAPVADGSVGTPSLFDVSGQGGLMRPMKLIAFEKRAGDLMWLRYKLRH